MQQETCGSVSGRQAMNSRGLVTLLIVLALVTSAAVKSQAQTCKGDCVSAACNFPVNEERGCRCFDGIDNDGNGKIDIADVKCATYYGLTFVGSGSTCSIDPPPGSAFTSMGSKAASSQNTSDTPAKIVVGDMNNDGVPDIVVTSKWNSTIQVVATANVSGFTPGDIMGDFRTPGSSIFPKAGSKYVFEHEVAIADINGDHIGEMYAIASERGGSPNNPPVRYFLTGFRYANKDLVSLFNAVDLGTDRPGTIGIADFDGDGKAEVYLRNRIYAAESGTLLADPGGNWDTTINAGSVAVNITGDSKLELVVGNLIYTVPSLAGRSLQTLGVFKDMNTLGGAVFFPKGYNDVGEYGVDQASSTSTADFDGDGFIDVLMTGAINCSGNEGAPCGTNTTTIFYWNVQKGTISTYAPPDGSSPLGWSWGTGRINLGDANGDGKLEALFVAGDQLFCLGLDATGSLKLLWVRTINDSLSGILSVTVYDFDNDGKPEVVYRDSQELAVVDGLTGATKKWSTTCQSHTFTEGPVIADANGDGSTDICVPCYTNNAFDITKSTPQQQSLGQVRLYYSNTNSWLPTRTVWNQHPYYVTNINDNLSLPATQMDPATIFSNAACPNGLPGPQRPLNLFMNQVPHLSASGCPEFPAPDLTFFGDDPAQPGVDTNGDGTVLPTVVVTPPICGNLDVKVVFNIKNNGDLAITDNVPVSFFNGDPTVSPVTAVKLFSTTINITNLAVGQTLTTAAISFNGPGTTFPLYIVLYNDGTSLPINLTGASTKECSISNNMYNVTITPDPFTTSIQKIQDNLKCSNAAPDNGELRAHVFKGGVEVLDYSPYTFQWYTGAGTGSPIPGPAGTNYDISGLAEGTYTLVVTNTAKGCQSAPISSTLVRVGSDPTITMTKISDQTKCSPANGQLQADIVGGNIGVTFEWFDVALNPLGITGNVAANLSAGNYVVRVTKDGCTKISNSITVNGPSVPDAQALTTQSVVDCSNPNSGAITANALVSGVVQPAANYTFDWYLYDNATSTRGSVLPVANGTGQNRTGLSVGYYQVVVTDKTTLCAAGTSPVTQVQSLTAIPVAQITQVSPQTSCDPLNPNGVLQGDALVGGVVQAPGTITYEWFKGDNTLPANKVLTTSGTNGQTANNVAGGGIFYTLKVKTALNCTATAKLAVTENLNLPVVTLTPANNTICDPASMSPVGNYNGAVAAAVTFGGAAVTDFTNYQFVWHNGGLSTDPVIAGATTQNLSQRNGGNYTLVVTRTDLACASAPMTAVVTNSLTLPTILTTPTPSTNCAGTPNGAIAAVVSTGAGNTTVGYTFSWFDGADTSFPAVLPAKGGNTANVFTVAGAANYTVQAVDNATGCANTLTTLLADNQAKPVLALTGNDNSICTAAAGFNGSVTSVLTDTNGPLNNHVYTWSNGIDMTSPIGGQTAATLANVNGGFYTATVTNTVLQCTSDPVTVEVLNNQVLPVINTTPTPSTNCAGPGNGSIAAVVNTGAGTTTVGYSFAWYQGDDNLAPAVAPGNGGTLPTAVNLQGGQNFTVEVTNSATGCASVSTITLTDGQSNPVLALTATPNTICDLLIGYNGSITSTLTDANAKPAHTYTYQWATGNTMAAVIAGKTTSTLTGRNGGFYSATVTNNTLQCTSAPVTVQVLDTPVIPALEANAVGSTNCTPSLKNGSVTLTKVNTVAPTAAFTYAWYSGATASGAVLATTTTLSGLQGGATSDFTIEVTTIATGCKNTLTENIPDNSVIPALTIATQPNDVCDPSKAFAAVTYTGQVTATVSNIGANVLNDYKFTWSTGLTGNGQNIINQLQEGAYNVLAVHNATGCSSALTAANVLSAKVPVVITTSAIGSTNCNGGTPNGSVTVDSVVPGGKTYSYSWYDGNVASGVVQSAAATYSGVQGGFNLGTPYEYTVQVTILETGCQNEATQQVSDDSSLPILSPLSHVDNKFCVGGNGSAAVTGITYQGAAVGPGFPGFTFQWSNGDVGPNTTTGLVANTYTVTATRTGDNCISNPVAVTINDNLFTPVIKVTKVDQTSCDALNPNGKLTAVIDESSIGGGAAVVAGYTFTWADNGNPFVTPGAAKGNGSQITNLVGNNNYTVSVVRSSTGCANQLSMFLDNTITIPTVTLTKLTNQTFCAPPDGSIQATIVPAPADTYTYYWLKEAPATTTTDAATVIATVNGSPASPNAKLTDAPGDNNDVQTGLSFGDYTFVAVDDLTQCVSIPVTATVLDKTTANFNLNVTTHPSTCGNGDGVFTINASRADAVATTFNFNVHKGGVTNAVTPVNFYSNPPTFDAAIDVAPFPTALGPVASGVNVTVSNVKSSTYTVVATDGFGCQSLKTFFLDFVDSPTISKTVTDSDQCPYTVGNGAVQANVVVPVTGPVTTPNQYIVRAFKGSNPVPANQIGADAIPVGPAFLPQNYTSLAPGFYTIEIQQNFGSLCKVQEVVEIKALSLPPVLDLNSALIANTGCGALNFNGKVDLKISADPSDKRTAGAIAATTYTITENAVPFPEFPGAVAAGTYASLANRGPADYTYQITASTGCTASRTYTILDEPVSAELLAGDIAVVDAEYCTPALEKSARVTVSKVRLTSGAIEVIGDYQFDWFADAALTTNLYSANGAANGGKLINDLPAGSGTVPAGTVTNGDYFVKVTKTADASGTGGIGCLSAPFAVTIQKNVVKPDLTITPTGDTSCDPTFFEGSLKVDASTLSGPGGGATYSYTWVPTGGVGQPANSAGNTGLGNVLNGINDGTYTLTAANEVTGCAVSLSTSLVKDSPPLFVITANATALTKCVGPDGKIDVTAIDLVTNGVSAAGNINDFDYVWYENSPSSTPVLDGTVVVADQSLNSTSYAGIMPLPSAVYYVKAVRQSGTGAGAGCESSPLKMSFNDQRAYPTATTVTTPNTACNNNFDATITLTPATTDVNGAAVPGPYDFSWTVKPATSTISNLSAVATYTYQAGDKINSGTYVSRVTNNTNGCFSDYTVFVGQNSVPVAITSTGSTPLTRCDINDGTASVNLNGTKVNGAVEPLGNFSYQWTDGSGNPAGVTATASSLTTGDYFVTITKTAVTAPGSGCSSPPVKVTVGDLRANPVLAFTTVANTACNNNFDGQISITSTTTDPNGATVAGPYQYTWTTKPVTAVITSVALPGNYVYQAGDLVGNGNYVVRVTNTTNGCFTDGSTTVSKNTLPVTVTAGTSTPLNNCLAPDGSVTVTAVKINNVAAPLADFTFAWTDNVLNPAGVGTTVNGLTVGTYAVKATKTATTSPAAGCISAPFKIKLLDNRENPKVSFATVFNTACDNNFDGKITVNASNAKAPGAGSNYDYTWTLVPAGSTVANVTNTGGSITTTLADVIGPGTYTVKVKNRTTQCFNDATTTIFSNKTPVGVVSVNKADQLICNPDGSISVNSLRHGVVADYTYQWFAGTATSPALKDATNTVITASTLNAGNYPTMGAGTYFVVATKKPANAPGSGCSTAPFRVNIKDLHVNPLLSFAFTPNSTCDPSIANGTTTGTATEVSGATGDTYSFVWTYNGAALPGITTQTNATASSQLANAYDGTYTLTAKNLTTTGCSVTASMSINLDQNVSKPNIINITTVDPLDCFPTGSGQVTSISIGGGAPITGATLGTSFSYEWYKSGFAPANLVAGQTTPTLNSILPDDYYVLVKDLATLCKSVPRQFTITKGSIVLPVVNITQPIRQISCNPAIGLGQLSGTADGQTDANPNYTFTWFNSLDGSGPAVANTSTFSNVKVGDYSMTALDLLTNCTNTTFFVVPDDSKLFTPNASATGEPLTLCVGQDGSMLVRVVNIDPTYPFPYNFSADLYFSGTPNLALPPDVAGVAKVPGFSTSFQQNGLGLGTYTARINDLNTGCFSTSTSVIEDKRVNPVVTIVQDQPMTNCDPVIANGQLSATADGGLVAGYQYNWFAGATSTGAVLAADNKLIGQPAGPYTVRVTRTATGCFADLTGTVTDATVLPFAPTVTVLSHRTNCLTPNGELVADVKGSQAFIFHWYDGSTASGTPDHTDLNYQNLDLGTYAVTATDPATLCVSPAATAEILDRRITPEFKLTATPSYCLDSGRDPIGTIILEATRSDFVLQDAQWTNTGTGASAGIGAQVVGLFPGVYEVKATTTEGCTNTDQAEVLTEIAPYNGISLNGDGKNDSFIIDCISLFPNNTVKVYNRNGVLVYEAHNYNNADRSFKGVGESGIYAIGNQLPDGTYYYIIDKGDGSKPVAGFLELMR